MDVGLIILFVKKKVVIRKPRLLFMLIISLWQVANKLRLNALELNWPDPEKGLYFHKTSVHFYLLKETRTR